MNLEKDNNIKSLFKLNIKDMTVEIEYSKNSISIKECMLNVLKHKK